jgi:hypothetical protein
MAHSPQWNKVVKVLQENYHNPDIQAVRAVYSAFAAHRLSGQPVWLMLVAPPGSMKTEILNALEGQDNTHFIDQITPNTFISGKIPDPAAKSKIPSGLRHRIGPTGAIVFSDFSTILELPVDKRGLILADMRRIYDGRLCKEFGTAAPAKDRTREGRITLLVAATPAIDRYYSIFQTLGERFVMVRWNRADGEDAALRAMNQDTSYAKLELKKAVKNLFTGLSSREPVSPYNINVRIAALAEFTVLARTHVRRMDVRRNYYTSRSQKRQSGSRNSLCRKGRARLCSIDAIS